MLSKALAVVALIFGILAVVSATVFGLSGAQEAGVGVIALAIAVLV